MILLVSSEKYWSVRVKPTDKERLLLRVKGGCRQSSFVTTPARVVVGDTYNQLA